MGNKEGKRVQQDSPQPRGAKIAVIAVAAVLVLLAAGYVGLCAWVSSGERVYPNTSALGADISGMGAGAALETVEAALKSQLGGQTLTLTEAASGHSAELPCDIVAPENLEAAIASALPGGSFLGEGFQYLRHLAAPTQLSADLTLSDEGTQKLQTAVDQLSADLSHPMVETSYEIAGGSLVLKKGTTGTAVDEEALRTDVLGAIGQVLSGERVSAVPVSLTDAPPPEPDLEAVYQQVYVEPADAYLDKGTKEIVPSVTGVSFDIAAVRSQVGAAAEGETLTIPLTYTEPNLTTAKLNANLFKDVLGTSTTNCASPSARWFNIDLAASRVNGTILLPGETFSYNALAGPYTEAAGYKKAGAYVGGKNIDTTAGGICQLSSTLYWTTLKANLEIVERNRHKYNSGYMPVVGTDATVYSDSLDFRFKNNTEYPIKVECYQDKKHVLHVTLYGTDTTGIHGEPYSVTLSTVPYKNTYKADSSIPVGSAPKRDTEYARYNGITVEVYQKLVDRNGSTVSTTFLHKDTYSVSNGVFLYNPADAARLGINPSTGLMTETPVTPTPSVAPSTEPTPGVTPSTAPSVPPSADPVVTPSPAEPTTQPTAAPSDDPLPPPEQSATPPPAQSVLPQSGEGGDPSAE